MRVYTRRFLDPFPVVSNEKKRLLDKGIDFVKETNLSIEVGGQRGRARGKNARRQGSFVRL